MNDAAPGHAADDTFVEARWFDAITRYSFSFAFEVSFAPERDGSLPSAGFRLESMHKELLKEKLPPEAREKWTPQEASDARLLSALDRELFDPVRSFHDDVTMGGPGRGGRPLIFAARGRSESEEARTVIFHRPPSWDYSAEGRIKRLHRPDGGGDPAPVAMVLRDTFSAFESGRLFYVLTLTQREDDPDPIDEYAVILLERLACDKAAEVRGRPLFSWPAGENGEEMLSLAQLAEARIAALEKDAGGLNGCTVIEKLQMKRGGEERKPVGPDDLLSLCIALDDRELARVAITSAAFAEDFAFPRAPRGARRLPVAVPGGALPHLSADTTTASAPYYALAGMLQGIPDFPFQDRSEIYDSTRPVNVANGRATYAHPRFTVEIGTEWRSLDDARECIGTCPYLLLMWLVAVHDEFMVLEIEELIDEVIYGNKGEGALRAEPLFDIRKVFDRIGSILPSLSTPTLEQNLRRRFDLFRWLSINQSRYLFRYDKEKKALEAIQNGMGTLDRHARAHELLDRLEALIEDVHDLKRAYSERRMNVMLGLIALFSLISVSNDLEQQVADSTPWLFLKILAIGVAGLVALTLGVSLLAERRRGWPRQKHYDNRSRKS